MTSIYRQALGADFDRLHPRMQWRFGFSSADGVSQVGTGVMDRVWRGPWWTVPFLAAGATRRVLFPTRGTAVPFSVANYAYVDRFGRETVTWARRFRFPRRQRAFDATMVLSRRRGVIVDYLGTRQHLAVDVHCRVDDEGALCLRTGEQRLTEGPVTVTCPLALSGVADVREWWDEEAGRFRIDVRVANERFGPLFGYSGAFDVVERPCTPADIPLDALPVREARRE